MVPHLTTSLTGPLKDLERLILDRRPDIEHWFRNELLEHEGRVPAPGFVEDVLLPPLPPPESK